jgi:hypothetical protein
MGWRGHTWCPGKGGGSVLLEAKLAVVTLANVYPYRGNLFFRTLTILTTLAAMNLRGFIFFFLQVYEVPGMWLLSAICYLQKRIEISKCYF